MCVCTMVVVRESINKLLSKLTVLVNAIISSNRLHYTNLLACILNENYIHIHRWLNKYRNLLPLPLKNQ